MDIGAAIANHYIWLRLAGRDGLRADFSLRDLTGVYLQAAVLTLADFFGADLSGANMSTANLSVTNLTGANLAGAELFGTNLWHANMLGAYWDYDLTRARDFRRIQFTNQRHSYGH